MTDHHADAGHGDDHHDFDHDLTPIDDVGDHIGDHQDMPGLEHHDETWEADDHPLGWEAEHHDTPDVEADPPPEQHDVAAEVTHEEPPANDEPVDLFPPHVDVGPLPEPVDGFPWVDSSSLGLIHENLADALAATPDPHELAEYSAEELPPAVDPWDHLAESEDPATAALAKFYRPDQT